MKQIKYITLLVLLFTSMANDTAFAYEMQKDLRIQDVFNRYGKKKNVTMVELSNEMLVQK